MSDKVNINQFLGVLYRPTPRVAGAVVRHMLRSSDPSQSRIHSLPPDLLMRESQVALNRYRMKRDKGPEGAEAATADWFGEAIRNRNIPHMGAE